MSADLEKWLVRGDVEGRAHSPTEFLAAISFKRTGPAALVRSLADLSKFFEVERQSIVTPYDDDFGRATLHSEAVRLRGDTETRKIVGSGQSRDPGKAAAIAAAETFERLGHYFSNLLRTPSRRDCLPTSSGCSFHTRSWRALFNGICELLERDPILAHWYGAQWLDWYPATRYRPLRTLSAAVESRGGILRVHHHAHAHVVCHSVFITAHFPHAVGHSSASFFCGLGGDPSLDVALTQAATELVRFVRIYFGVETDVLDRLASLRPGSAFARMWMYQIPENQGMYLDRCREAGGPPPSDVWRGSRRRWTLESLSKTHHDVESLPIPPLAARLGTAVRVTAPNLQQLDYDEQPRVNERRIYDLVGPHARIVPALHCIP